MVSWPCCSGFWSVDDRCRNQSSGLHVPLGVPSRKVKKDTALDDMVRRADRALYRSKRAGRNQVDLESSQLMLAADGTLQRVPTS